MSVSRIALIIPLLVLTGAAAPEAPSPTSSAPPSTVSSTSGPPPVPSTLPSIELPTGPTSKAPSVAAPTAPSTPTVPPVTVPIVPHQARVPASPQAMTTSKLPPTVALQPVAPTEAMPVPRAPSVRTERQGDCASDRRASQPRRAAGGRGARFRRLHGCRKPQDSGALECAAFRAFRRQVADHPVADCGRDQGGARVQGYPRNRRR